MHRRHVSRICRYIEQGLQYQKDPLLDVIMPIRGDPDILAHRGQRALLPEWLQEIDRADQRQWIASIPRLIGRDRIESLEQLPQLRFLEHPICRRRWEDRRSGQIDYLSSNSTPLISVGRDP